jgi:effector-binding domain-containing protein
MTTIEVEQREPQRVLNIRQTVPIADLAQAQGASLYELRRLLHDRGVTPTGRLFVRYDTLGDVETGVPLGPAVVGAGRISRGELPVSRGELPGGRAVTTVHLGAHDRLGGAYNRIQEWLATYEQPAGPAWEVYEWIDLTREPDLSSWPAPADWRIQLVQPVA